MNCSLKKHTLLNTHHLGGKGGGGGGEEKKKEKKAHCTRSNKIPIVVETATEYQ